MPPTRNRGGQFVSTFTPEQERIMIRGLRDDLTLRAIAAETGLPKSVVGRYKLSHNWQRLAA